MEALGETAAGLVKEGRELIQRLESGQVESGAMRKRFRAWLKRIRKLLESPPGINGVGPGGSSFSRGFPSRKQEG